MTKLEALYKVNEKIIDIQKDMNVKINSSDGVGIDFKISDNGIMNNNKIGEKNLYKKINIENDCSSNIENMILYYGPSDSIVERHNHEQAQLFICIEGFLLFIIDGEEFVIKKGQSIYVNSFQWHEFKFLESSKLIVIYF